MEVKIVSADVACSSKSVDSAVLALEVHNSFLLNLKKEGKDYIDELNKCTAGQGVVLDKSCTRLLSTVEKVAGKLATKFNQAKGSWQRNKIRSGKTHIIIRSGETVNAATVEEQLHQAEVKLYTIIIINLK